MIFGLCMKVNMKQKNNILKNLSHIFIIVTIVLSAVLFTQLKVSAVSDSIPRPVLSSQTVTKPAFTWKSVGSAYTYRIYRSNTKNGNYKCLEKEYKGTSYTDDTAVAGKQYYYTVRATKTVKGKIVYGTLSAPLYIQWVKDEITLTLQVDSSGSYLKWTNLKAKNSTKYKYNVYTCSSINGKYNCVKTGLTENSYKLNLSSKKDVYYYKVKPYRIINDKKVYGAMSNICLNQKTVDLVIFMGQSNMAGRGENLSLVPKTEVNTAYEFKAVTNPNKLYTLEEPFGKYENVVGAINDVSSSTNAEIKSGGMVASLCKSYFEQTGIPIVGVSASISNTSIWEFQPGKAILTDAITRLNTAKAWLNKNGYNIRHIYMVYCQGEADHKMNGETYIKNAKVMIEEMRKHGVEMCFFVGLGNHLNYPGIFQEIQNAQVKLCNTYKYAFMTTTIARSLVDKGMMNYTSHYSQAGYNLVGQEAGKAMGAYVNKIGK